MRVLRTLLAVTVPVGIAVVAFLNARAVAALVEGTVSGGMVMPAMLDTNANANANANAIAMANAKSAGAILDRNPFDHVTGSLRPPPPPGDGPVREVDLDPAHAPICEGVRPLVLVGDDDQSVALASLDYGGKRILRKRGGDVGEARVAYVGRDRVWLEGRMGLCQALLFGTPPPKPVVTAGDPLAQPRSAFELEIEKKIAKTGPNEFSIDRSAVDRILEAQQEIMKSRLVPDKDGDRIVGMKIFGIKQGSVLGMLGIENGDRLETINGFEVSSPEKMLEAYARIRAGADRLTVHLTRAGKPLNVDYTIR